MNAARLKMKDVLDCLLSLIRRYLTNSNYLVLPSKDGRVSVSKQVSRKNIYESSFLPLICYIAQVIKVPKMGDSISEGTVQTFKKSK